MPRRAIHRLAPSLDAHLDAPADSVWQRVCDTRAWPEWAPGVTDTRATTQHAVQGTRGAVKVAGVWLRVRVRDFEHARTLAVQVAGLPGPRLTVAPEGAGCRVTVRGAPRAWARAALQALGSATE